MYHLLHFTIRLLSLLPLQLLYVLSDFSFLLVYYVLGYRRKVVKENLAASFPEMTNAERLSIEKKFYRNFTDNVFETIKLFRAGKRFAETHMEGDFSLPLSYLDRGQKVQVLLGHFFNWELSNLFAPLRISKKFLGVYMPIENAAVDRLFKELRASTGTVLIAATRMTREILPYRNDVYMLGLIADQTPATPENAYWIQFLNRPTAFLKGPEKGARAGNVPVLFCSIKKIARGRFRAEFQLVTDQPAQLPEGSITSTYASLLEEKIREQPENWLWSHRRWKHEWRPEFGPVMEPGGQKKSR